MQPQADSLQTTPQDIWLNQLRSATRYNQWIFSYIQPHIKGRTLEVGCGNGNFTTLIAEHCTELLAVDLDASYTQQTKTRLRHHNHVKVLNADATTMHHADPFDTIIMLDVLEHIEDDLHLLNKLQQSLSTNGKLILKVPSISALYNSLDKAVGHHRRYTRHTLADTLHKANYTNPTFQYFNLVGIFGWWLNGTLGRTNPPGEQVGLFDRCVPIFQTLEARLGCPVGLSLFAIASTNNQPKNG